MPSRKTDRRTSALGALGLAAVIGGSLLIGVLTRRSGQRTGGHAAPDLALDQPHPGPEHRAPDAFRPDPRAPVPDAERDAFAPATIPSVVGRGL